MTDAGPRETTLTSRLQGMAAPVLIVLGLWLAWQIVLGVIVQKAPVDLAYRLAPTSPLVLARMAEHELAEDRLRPATNLAVASISRAPFSVLGMRVLAQTLEKAGRMDDADQAMTLAGNWSLRDNLTHAWLVDHRLRQGDYPSAFGHADTLARRRNVLWPHLFPLFTRAAEADPRAIQPLLRGLTVSPPWRPAYLLWLQGADGNMPLLGTLAVALQSTDAPLTDDELLQIYVGWVGSGRIEAVRGLRRQIGRPDPDKLVQDGEFPLKGIQRPFGWEFGVANGIASEIVEDEIQDGQTVLRVDHDGRAADRIARQFLLLPAGSFRLAARIRAETGEVDARVVPVWRIRCFESGEVIAEVRGQATARWSSMAADFMVPARNCTAQWLDLEPVPGESVRHAVVLFDGIAVQGAANRP